MMNQPTMDTLRGKVDSRYTLVVLTARRARQLLDGAQPMVEIGSEKAVTIAIQEVAQDKVGWERSSSVAHYR